MLLILLTLLDCLLCKVIICVLFIRIHFFVVGLVSVVIRFVFYFHVVAFR